MEIQMEQTQIFEVISQSPYHITIHQIKNIEDCPDEFITEEELREMGVDHCWSGTRYMKGKIISKIQQYLAQIPKGKKSIIIDDNDLIEALKEGQYSVSNFVKGTRRVGNRLFKYDCTKKEQTEVKFDDWKMLVIQFQLILRDKYGVIVDINLTASKRQETINQFKKLIDWSLIVDRIEKHKLGIDETQISWMKKLYENPTLIKELNDEK
jgi:hypothetical protein